MWERKTRTLESLLCSQGWGLKEGQQGDQILSTLVPGDG